MTYDNQRSMFEAYARNKYVSTGVIQWMLNNCLALAHLASLRLLSRSRRRLLRHQKAQEIVHVQYDYDANSVSVINRQIRRPQRLQKSPRSFSILMPRKSLHATHPSVFQPTAPQKPSISPRPDNLSTSYFLKLQLDDASGALVSDNFYWLSTKPDTMDWKHKKTPSTLRKRICGPDRTKLSPASEARG